MNSYLVSFSFLLVSCLESLAYLNVIKTFFYLLKYFVIFAFYIQTYLFSVDFFIKYKLLAEVHFLFMYMTSFLPVPFINKQMYVQVCCPIYSYISLTYIQIDTETVIDMYIYMS